MPLNLLKFPPLVQDEIFRNMTYNQLFLISFTNVRVKQIIGYVKYNVAKLIFEVTDSSFCVRSASDSEREDIIIELIEDPLMRGNNFSTVKLNDDLEVAVQFRCQKNIRFNMVVSDVNKRLQNALQTHINTLFRNQAMNYFVQKTRECFIGSLGVENISHSKLMGPHLEVSVLERYLDEHPNHQSIALHANIKGEFTDDSKVFGIQSVRVDYPVGATFLQKFSGKHLILYQAKISTVDVIQFLNKWVTNEDYQNLESLWIDFVDGFGIQNGRVIEELAMVRFNRHMKWPKSFIYDPKLIDFTPRSVNLDNASFFKVIRNGDNKEAFIYCSSGILRFFVLNDLETLY